MNERVKELRRSLGLTQDVFGSKLGLKKSAISLIESGSNSLTEQTIKSICREFNVSYLWLTTGEGPMMEPESEDAALHVLIDALMAGENEHVRAVFKSLTRLSVEDWRIIDGIIAKLKKGE